MIETLVILQIVTLCIAIVTCWFVARPKIIEIEKNPEGIRSQAIITPSGTFQRVEKREPVVNDDEALFLREETR